MAGVLNRQMECQYVSYQCPELPHLLTDTFQLSITALNI